MPNGSGETPLSASTCGPSGEHCPSAIRHGLRYSASRKVSSRSLDWKRVCLRRCWLAFCQGSFLECEMGMQLGLRRLHRLIIEPSAIAGAIDASLQ